jgi:hypothetical protein
MHKDDSVNLEVTIRGKVEFTDDYTDIKGVADDDSKIRVVDERGGTTRKFEAVSDRSAVRSNFNYPLLRYPDVLMIFAEADNEVSAGPSSAALEAVNMIRRRNGASTISTMSQQAFRSFVLEERRRELALEGDRRWDLLRWGIYLPVMNAIDIDENNVVKRRSNKNLLYPIPMSELNSNKLITGNNPGW